MNCELQVTSAVLSACAIIGHIVLITHQGHNKHLVVCMLVCIRMCVFLCENKMGKEGRKEVMWEF